jgi:hypothetical protein
MLEVSLDTRLSGSFRYDNSANNWLARINDLSKLGINPGGDFGNQLADRPTKMFLNRYSVDLGQPFINVEITQIGVEAAQADRQVLINA